MTRTDSHRDDGAQPVIETAVQFYRELKSRGLHLRAEYGRDNVLLAEVRERLGLQRDSLAHALKEGGVSAEEFLIAFLRTSAPFAKMFSDIWDYLAHVAAPAARERIRVRFGLRDNECEDVDLEQFREWEERSRTVYIRLLADDWTEESLRNLFKVAEVFRGYLFVDHRRSTPQPWSYYEVGKPLALMAAPAGADDLAAVGRRVHSMLHAVADEGVRLRGRTRDETPEYAEWRKAWGYPLTDHVPAWQEFFDRIDEVPSELRARTVEAFYEHVAPLLGSATTTREERFRQALEVLALPFWRYRWHTYEIWATVAVLRALDGFRPAPNILDGHLLIDGYDSATVARLLCHEYPEACVVAQLETPFARGKRTAIKPDLSICFDSAGQADSRAAVIEMKQRVALDAAHVREVVTSYRDGSPRARVILVNYDRAPSIEAVDRTEVIDAVHPGCLERVARFEDSVREALDEAGLQPDTSRLLVLLDVSSSMARSYDSEAVKKVLSEMIRWKVKLRRFNQALLPAPTLEEVAGGLLTNGGTDLRAALEASLDIHSDRTLVVSDADLGGVAEEELRRIRRFDLIAPSALPRSNWSDPTPNLGLGGWYGRRP